VTVRLEIHQPVANTPALSPQFNKAGQVTGFGLPQEAKTKPKF
jgi:hypothetical protein